MSLANAVLRAARRGFALALILSVWPVIASAAYPPTNIPEPVSRPVISGKVISLAGLIFSNTHNYGNVIIKVEVYNNYLGDFTKYWWVYTVTNVSFEPNPPSSNGFSGFELNLPVAVPDIATIAAPDGIPPWLVNCCSGLPVEWDLRKTDGIPVNGGTLPGETEQYSFTTSPRLITISNGWYHTWETNAAGTDVQTFVTYYPTNDPPEVPDVLSEPNQELCCSKEPATGGYICQVLPAGQCETIGGVVVNACSNCPPVVPALKKTWGKVKADYR